MSSCKNTKTAMNESFENKYVAEGVSLENKGAGKELIVLAEADETLQKAEIEAIEVILAGRQAEESAIGPKIHEKVSEIEGGAKTLLNSFKEKVTNIVFGQKENEGQPKLPKEIFFPEEELERVKRMGLRGRKEALGEWKEKYAKQKETLANFQEEMIGRIRQCPDMHLDNFRFIKEEANRLGFTPEQKENILSIFNAYARKHNEVASIRREHPNDGELFEALFKSAPKGKIEVVEGPMTLYFKCFNVKDYALIYSQSFSGDKEFTEHDINVANMSQGCSIPTAPIKGLEGCIIAENRFVMNKRFQSVEGFSKVYSPARNEWIDEKIANENILATSENTRIHEEQHAIKRLFFDRLLRRNTFKELLSSKTDNEREKWLANYLRYTRQSAAEPRAKDEILAFFKDGTNPTETLKYLTESKKEGGLYDYLDDDNIEWPSRLQYMLQVENYKKLYDKTRNKIYTEEYHALIENSIHNAEFLEQNGRTKEQVIALLINEPLSKWAKVVGRLVAGKRIAKEK